MNKYVKFLLGLPKTLRINFKYFKFSQAIKLPIIVSPKVKFIKLSGKVTIDAPIKTGMIKFGFSGSGTHSIQTIALEFNGILVFKGNCSVGGGNSIVTVKENSILQIGNNVQLTGGSTIISGKKVTINDNCIISWDCLIMDTDFHKIYNKDGQLLNEDQNIIIGKNVWIGCKVLILKGSVIQDFNIIAANTVITRSDSIGGNRQIIGGNPLKVLKEEVTWG